MKNVPIIAFAICMIAPCITHAQNGWTGIDMPFTPKRDTNHIHILRTYTISDTVTMERKLLSTVEYDHHGYPVSPDILLTYNEKGQLVKYVRFEHHNDWEGHSRRDTMPTEVSQIQYTPEGMVEHVKSSFYYNGDSALNTYDLVTYKAHPRYGVLDCSYLGTHKSASSVYNDTSYFRQRFDSHGHLIYRAIYDTYYEDNTYTILRYHYDTDGRLAYRTGEYSEFQDSIVYQYDADGTLTGMTGKYYDMEVEGDVTIRCQPDGRMIEQMIHWYAYEDNPDPFEQTTNLIYDSHGVPVSNRMVGPDAYYYVYEIEYWE